MIDADALIAWLEIWYDEHEDITRERMVEAIRRFEKEEREDD